MTTYEDLDCRRGRYAASLHRQVRRLFEPTFSLALLHLLAIRRDGRLLAGDYSRHVLTVTGPRGDGDDGYSGMMIGREVQGTNAIRSPIIRHAGPFEKTCLGGWPTNLALRQRIIVPPMCMRIEVPLCLVISEAKCKFRTQRGQTLGLCTSKGRVKGLAE